jgi:hypothetical protein
VITDNHVSQIESWSIVLDQVSDNKVYGNSFLDAAPRALDNGKNSWDFAQQGNFWGNYNGSGTYSISPDGIDNYPLTKPAPIVPIAPPELKRVTLNSAYSTEYTVDTQETWTNENMANVGIHVTSSGNLTLRNVTLAILGGIQVDPGGSLYIYNSVITSGNTTVCGYTFFVVNPKTIVIEGSMIEHAGFDFGTDYPGGLAIINGQTSSAVIKNNIFSHDYTALFVSSILHIDVANNTILYSYDGIVAGSTTGPIIGNNITDVIHDGFMDGGGAGTLFESNYIRNAWGVGIQINDGFNFTAADNYVLDTEDGILVSSAPNSPVRSAFLYEGEVITNNTVASCTGWGAHVNLGMKDAANFTFYGNTILNCHGGIYMEAGSHGVSFYHNNIINSSNSVDLGNITWTHNGEGNYWSDYTGKDANFDGIGDTPYTAGGITDSYPFMKPNGWLTKFYLTLDTDLPASTAFQINGTSFSVGQGGTVTLRLGYVADYSLTLPQTVKLANGSTLAFSRWGDGTMSSSRTLQLSANSTLAATYVLEAPTITTTTSSSSITTSSTSATASSSTSTTSSSTKTPSQATTTLEFALVGVVAVVLVVLGVIFFRRRHS